MCFYSDPKPFDTYHQVPKIMTMTKKDQIRALLKSIETGDPGPVAVVNEAEYVQHNPQTREGSEGLAALFRRLSKSSPRVNIVRAFEDGDFVFAHTEYDFASRKIGFEVFRFEDGQAVEHWDNIQERIEPNQSGRTMVDGPTEAVDLELTESNRALARSFVEVVLVDGHLDRLAKFIDADTFAEHNRQLGDGVSLLLSALKVEDENGTRIDYQRIHRVLAEGNFVLCVSEGSNGGVHTAFYDLFRLAKGKVVEHWDTTEKIAPRSEWKNDNGKF
jgi:predicted SnoaL-like aldol condensation-catalyzing enzyme